MLGISTFDDVDTVKGINKRYKLGMEKALNIDVSQLGDDLVAELDSAKGHVSIKPSDDYVSKNFGGDMVAALEGWRAGGDDQALSKSVQNAVTGTTCL